LFGGPHPLGHLAMAFVIAVREIEPSAVEAIVDERVDEFGRLARRAQGTNDLRASHSLVVLCGPIADQRQFARHPRIPSLFVVLAVLERSPHRDTTPELEAPQPITHAPSSMRPSRLFHIV